MTSRRAPFVCGGAIGIFHADAVFEKGRWHRSLPAIIISMHGVRALCVLLLFVADGAWAAKRDFKGLFGSYRRERFIENEAQSSDFGIDVMVSTLLPLTNIVSSQETSNGPYQPLYYAAFFNGELSFLFTINYHFETFLTVGYYTYETRKENKELDIANPLFHEFALTAAPVLVGLRYRLSQEDLVPYLGAGLGMTHVRQTASYAHDSQTRDESAFNAITGE